MGLLYFDGEKSLPGSYKPPPKQGTPRNPGSDLAAFTSSEQARPLPIGWGRVKVPVTLLEKFAPNQHVPVDWPPSTSVPQYLVVKNGNNVYECATAGTTAASGGPSGTASSISDGTATWRYIQTMPCLVYSQVFVGALCEGEIVGAVTLYVDKEKITAPGATSPGRLLTLAKGVDAANQTVPALFGFDTSGYQHTAWIAPLIASFQGMPTGTQTEIPDMAVEIDSVMLGVAGPDVPAADLVIDLWTHVRRGCGKSSGQLDAGITGAGAASYRVYCDAAGLRFSMLLDTQKTALDLLADILNATNSDAVWSGGKLKIVPLADQSLTSPVFGGVNYVPANTAQYNLGLDDFLDKGQPVQVQRRSDADCFNCFSVQYIDRGMGYATSTVEDPDQTDIEVRGGMKRGSPVTLPVIFPNGTAAVMISRNFAQRSLNIRNQYSFRLPWSKILLEPTDVVTSTETALGLVLTPMRVIEWSENEDGTASFICEDYPQGVAAAGGYTPQAGDGYQSNDPATTAKNVPQVIATNQVTSPPNDNLWPNGTSELNPPAALSIVVPNDGSNAEWDFRFNAGAGAYSGNWVRRMVVLNGQTFVLTLKLPASQSEQYWLQTQWKCVASGGINNVGATIGGQWLDSSGAGIGATFGNTQLPAAPTAWAQMTFQTAAAPAGTASLQIVLQVGASNPGSGEIQFDAIYVRRVLDPAIVTPGATGQVIGMSGGVAAWLGDTSWTALTPGAGLANFGAPFDNWGAKKGADGVVRLRGLLTSAGGIAAGAVMGNAPAAYRPTTGTKRLICEDSSIAKTIFPVDIDTAGNFKPAFALPAGGNVSFEGISFDTT